MMMMMMMMIMTTKITYVLVLSDLDLVSDGRQHVHKLLLLAELVPRALTHYTHQRPEHQLVSLGEDKIGGCGGDVVQFGGCGGDVVQFGGCGGDVVQFGGCGGDVVQFGGCYKAW